MITGAQQVYLIRETWWDGMYN